MKFGRFFCQIVLLATIHICSLPSGAKARVLVGEPCSAVRTGILRQYPMPGAVEVSCGTGIGITAASRFNLVNRYAADFDVVGSRSGRHGGRMCLSRDGSTILFRPYRAFDLSDTVQVTFSGKLDGGVMLTDTFQFITEKNRLVTPPTTAVSSPASLLPLLGVTVDSAPSPGRLFLNSTGQPDLGNLLILNEDGRLLKYFPAETMDFGAQPNGLWTYFVSPDSGYAAVDSNFTPIRFYQCTNGVSTDPHDLVCSSDGSYTMLGVIKTTADMRQIVAGGDSSATVQSNVIQRFDASDSLIFEWRGLDHYEIKDAIHEDLTGSLIDFEHANSIDIDSDGNYLLSNRALSEVTKIDGRTGAILWRFGGLHNQFAIQNDSVGFSYQHDARRLPNGHITLFDNGNFREPATKPESRAVEYTLDTSTMTARLAWQYRHTPPVRAAGMGSVQRLPNGNTLIGWGVNLTVDSNGNGQTATATEVTDSGKKVFEMDFQNPGPPLISYRVRKYPYTARSAVADWPPINPQQISTILPTIFEASDDDGISFETTKPEEISVTLHDMLGRTIERVYQGMSSGGPQQWKLPKSAGLSNGIYFCVIQSTSGMVVRSFAVGR